MQVINTGRCTTIVLTPEETNRLSADLMRSGVRMQSDPDTDQDFAVGDRLEQLGVELELSATEVLLPRDYHDVPGP